MKILLAALLLLLSAPLAQAQLLTTTTAITISAANTFQLALCGVGVSCSGTVGTNRRSATIFNINVTGATHVGDIIFVYFAGSDTGCANATQAKAVPVSPGASISFVAGGAVLYDTICVTGPTTGDQAVLLQQ